MMLCKLVDGADEAGMLTLIELQKKLDAMPNTLSAAELERLQEQKAALEQRTGFTVVR